MSTTPGEAPAGATADRRRLESATALFSAATGASRILGFAREIAARAIFGTGIAIQAFTFAFNIPNLLRSLVADAALSAAFVPVFTELRESGRRREAWQLASTLAVLVALGLGTITAIAMLAAPLYFPLVAGGLSDEAIRLSERLALVIFPIVPLLGLTGLATGILNAHDRFGWPAIAPVFWNLVIIVSLVVIVPLVGTAESTRAYVYAGGVLVGTLVQFALPLPQLRSVAEGGFVPMRLSAALGDLQIRRIGMLMLPVTVGLGLINFNAVIDIAVAARIPDTGDVASTLIDPAFRIYMLPQGMFSVAVATVLFPALSRHAANRRLGAMGHDIGTGMAQIGFLLIPCAVYLAVLSEPIMRLVYEHGRFDAQATTLGGRALLGFAPGLFFAGANLLLTRAFFSLQRPWFPTFVAAGNLVVNLVLDLLLAPVAGIGGITLVTSIVSVATFALLARRLAAATGGLGGVRVRQSLARVLVASLELAVVVYGGWALLDRLLGRSLVAQVVTVGVPSVLGAMVYLRAARRMRIREAAILDRITARLRRR